MRIDYLRIFSSFAPTPGDPYVAGGALDEYKVLKEIDRKTAERLFEVIYK